MAKTCPNIKFTFQIKPEKKRVNTLGFRLSLSTKTQHSSFSRTKGSSFSSLDTISYPSVAANLLTRYLSDFSGSFKTTTSPTKTRLSTKRKGKMKNFQEQDTKCLTTM